MLNLSKTFWSFLKAFRYEDSFFAQFLSQDSNLNFPALCNQLYSHFAHFAVLKFSNFYLLLEI